jgi:hypothetical protein
MGVYDYLNIVSYFINLKLTFVEEIIVVFLFYNFLKLVILGAVVELIWPTQFFNRKHSSAHQLLKFRTFTETLIKLRPTYWNYYIFNKAILKYFFIKYVNRIK